MKEITAGECLKYRELSEDARKIQDALHDLAIKTMQSGLPEKSVINILEWIRRADTFRGLSYFLTPQTEWTGGDSSDPKNFKITEPHIAR